MAPMTMRVGLIGHRGFVGSALAVELRAACELVGIDRASYAAHRGERFDVLVNAGGSGDKRAAERDPHADFDANVLGTLASLRDFAYEHYVLISSVDVYSDRSDPARTSEDSPIDPFGLSSYGTHKLVGEMLVRGLARGWTIFRLGPLVGPGLRRNAVFDLLTTGKLFVDPASTYPYIDTQAVAGIVASLMTRQGDVFNVAAGRSVSLTEIAARLDVPLVVREGSLPVEHYRIAITKLARYVDPPDPLETVLAFARAWRTA